MSAATTRSLMTLHVGQAGVQIGHAVWELFCLEHNIGPDGRPKLHCGDFGNEAVFTSTPTGHYIPRSLFVDSDPSCIDELRSGPYRDLFSSRQLVSNHFDAASNYTTGRYGFAKTMLPETLDRLRWMMEKADSKPTICLIHSACGGTGSGFSAACLARMSEELSVGAQNVIDFCLIPSVSAVHSSCELLNTALYLDESQDMTRSTFCMSNSAMYRICNAQLHSRGAATFAHVNRIMATAFSNLTATERLQGSSIGLKSILDSLLPFRHLRYPTLACAPFLTGESARTEQPSIRGITTSVLEPSSQFLDVDMRSGRLAAGFLLYRGGAELGAVQSIAAEMTQRNRERFYDWAPSGFSTGVVSLPPLAPPGSGMADTPVSVTLLANHSGLAKIFSKMANAAKSLQDRDMFVHNYESAIVSLLAKNAEKSAKRPVKPLDSSSVRQWDTPPAHSGPATSAMTTSELHQHSRRRLGSREPDSGAQSSQQQTEERPTSRTGALSDVFGVRIRLSSAIDYLNSVSRSCSETRGDRKVEDLSESASITAATDDDLDQREDQKASEIDDEEGHIQQSEQQDSDPKSNSEDQSDVDKEARRDKQPDQRQSQKSEPRTSQEPKTTDANELEANKPLEEKPDNRAGSEVLDNNANLWCWRRCGKPSQTGPTSSAASATRHPAIIEAERILMKHRQSLNGNL